jgi:hypothetical protein
MRFQNRRVLRSVITANLPAKHEPTPMRSSSDATVTELDGIINEVDPISRELNLRAGEEALQLYVPLDCPIVLNSERVKLRLLQPGDRARVCSTRAHGIVIALSITVSWNSRSDESIVPGSADRAPDGLMVCTGRDCGNQDSAGPS